MRTRFGGFLHLEEKLLARLLAFLLAGFARLVSGVRVCWEGCLPHGTRQRVYYFNHTSHADGLLLWAIMPPEVRPWVRLVAAEEYWNANFLRRFIADKVFGAIFVRRDAADLAARKEQVSRVVEGLGRDYSLIFSPEGTRGTGESILPFKTGLYHLCLARPDLELVPCYLENFHRLLPKGEYFPLPLLCRIRVGAPLYFEPGEPRQSFLERSRKALEDLMEER